MITEPQVYLISRQEIDEHQLDSFLGANDVHGWETDTEIAADKLVEVSGRNCYQSWRKPRPGGNKTYIDHIKEAKHGSTLEHSVFGFLVEGVSRSFTHELIRHRQLSPSQLSQRYVENNEYVAPLFVQWDKEMSEDFEKYTKQSSEVYDKHTDKIIRKLTHWHLYNNPQEPLTVNWAEPIKKGLQLEYVHDVVETLQMCWPFLGEVEGVALTKEFDKLPVPVKTHIRKEARGTARWALPNATETKLMLTANCRAWRNILEQRGSRHAEQEIRRVMNKILPILQKEAPNIFSDYIAELLEDGTYEITTPHVKI